MRRVRNPEASGPLDAFPPGDLDVEALEANLSLSPAERVRELVEMNRLHHDVQSRSLTTRQRELLWELEIEQARQRLDAEHARP